MVEHVDPEVLALAALGEPVADVARDHLAVCATCAAEVASLSAVVAAGRSAPAAGLLVAPSAVVWDRIRAELELSAGLDPESGRPGEEAEAAPEPALAPVVPLRRRRPWIATAAAAAGLVIGGAAGTWWATGPDRDETTPAVVARAELDPLPGWDASGTASVERAADGSRVLVVTVDGAAKAGDFREVWLLDPDVTQLVSLGILQGSEGRFTVPDGLDLAALPVVDVSEEALDGDPAHSGDSVVRGVLGA
ncbi:anti-sigma factor [Pengzhenrongella sicca]|uniref:Anti-sigma factor n=1 Tax=Pengzhenrongella sicca TaxID=2819238 RepID=A0A8A4ZFH9_9MICO|nr:anti-sigma factor [Pengzhenrongella sicca]QTE29296.1 anti-sigma factor [Pengzhenrongella sicca]